MSMTKQSGRKTKKSGRAGTAVTARGRAFGMQTLFAGRAIVALLRLFLLSPTREFYQRELAELSGERLFSIQRALDRLVAVGVVEKATRGNRVYYHANQSYSAFQDLKALIFKTVGMGDTLRTQLAGIRDRAKVAFIYGSVARGEETASSDIDVMLIGDLSGREIASVFAPVKRLLNREINPSVYRPGDFRRKVREGHVFLTTVLKEPKLFLLGNEDDIKAILGRRSA